VLPRFGVARESDAINAVLIAILAIYVKLESLERREAANDRNNKLQHASSPTRRRVSQGSHKTGKGAVGVYARKQEQHGDHSGSQIPEQIGSTDYNDPQREIPQAPSGVQGGLAPSPARSLGAVIVLGVAAATSATQTCEDPEIEAAAGRGPHAMAARQNADSSPAEEGDLVENEDDTVAIVDANTKEDQDSDGANDYNGTEERRDAKRDGEEELALAGAIVIVKA
jgi:hypothetical protein